MVAEIGKHDGKQLNAYTEYIKYIDTYIYFFLFCRVLLQVDENSWVLHQTVLKVNGVAATELTVDAVFAPFSPPPTKPVIGHVVLAVPPAADKMLENDGDIKGR